MTLPPPVGRWGGYARRATSFVAIAGLACSANPRTPFALDPLGPSALELPVQEVHVENGPRFLILPRSGAPTVAMSVVYPVGAADDPTSGSGTAHLLEHMLFKGSTSVGTYDIAAERPLLERLDAVYDSLVALGGPLRGNAEPSSAARTELQTRFEHVRDSARAWVRSNDYASLLEEHGAVGLNASTTPDLTSYYVELPANRVELWMILESDRMANPVFREFHTERDVVLEERRSRVSDSPPGQLLEAHLGAAYPEHPYGRPTIGTQADLDGATRTDVRTFYDRHYHPSRAVIGIVGDIDPLEVREWIDEYFGVVDWGPPEQPLQEPVLAPTPRGPVQTTVEAPAEPRLRVGWRTIDGGHADAPALAVAASLLANGRTSRLHRRMVADQQVAVFVGAGLGPGSRYEQLLAVDVIPRAPYAPDTLLGIVLAEVERLATQPPEPVELARIRRQLAAGQVRRLRSNLGLALELSSEAALRGDWRGTLEFTRRMARVTGPDVQQAVRRHLREENRSVAVLAKSTARARPSVASAPIDPSVPGSASPNADASPPRAVEPRRPGPAATARDRAAGFRARPLRLRPPRTQQRRMGRATVLLVEDHELPLVDVVFHFRGGAAFFPRDRMGIATAMPALLRTGGAGALSPDSVDGLVEGWAFEAAFGGGGQSVVSSLGVLTRDLAPALELWGQLLSDPRFDTGELEVWRNREEESIRRRGENPITTSYALFNSLMFGDHPVGWTLEAQDVSVERLTTESLLAYHNDVVCQENLVVGVSGDTDFDELDRLLHPVIAALPRCESPLGRPPLATVRREAGLFLSPRPGASQSTIVIGVGTPVTQEDSPQYFASQVANTILGASGLSSRLFQRLRSEEGLAYSASSVWTTPPEGEGVFATVTQTRADATVESIRTVFDELTTFRANGPAAREVDRTVHELTNGYALAFRDARQVVVRRLGYLRMGLPEDWLERRTYQIGQVRASDVRAVLQRHVDPTRLTVLIVGDPQAFDLGQLRDLLGEPVVVGR